MTKQKVWLVWVYDLALGGYPKVDCIYAIEEKAEAYVAQCNKIFGNTLEFTLSERELE